MPSYNDFDIAGPYESNSGWGNISSALGSIGSSVGSGTFTGIGSMLGSVGTAVGGALDIGSAIANLFKPNAEGKAKIDATKAQQLLEQWSSGIEKQVSAGTMDAGVAIKALQNLAALAGGYGSTAQDKAGMLRVLTSINQQLANLKGKYNLDLGRNVTDKNLDKNAAGGLSSNFSDPNQQQDWMKQQFRNKLMGFSAGDANLAGSPAEKLFKPAFDVSGGFDSMLSKVKNTIPDYTEPFAFSALKKKLEG
jgi:hypothetical protein